MIFLKSASDFEKMRVAGAIVRDVLALMEEKCKEGVTTVELDKIAESYIRKCGAEPSFLNYNGFPYSICASVNDEVVHGFPSDRPLRDGDIVSIDVGAVINGFHGDAARTFLIGNVAPETKKLVEVTKECFFKGAAAFKEGNRISDIGKAVQGYAESFGYGVVREMIGHGIGRKMHEDPEVPNYFTGRRGERLETGMALAIEPMITLGSPAIFEAENGWTVVTCDGKPAAHYENTTILTKNGLEILTL